MKAVLTFNHAASSWQLILRSGTRANISPQKARWFYDRGHPMIVEGA